MTKKISTPIAIGIIFILAVAVGAGVWWYGEKSNSLTFTGKMTFSPIAGGCWDFISDDKKGFELIGEKATEIRNIPDILKKKIRVEGRIRKDMVSICFGGRDGFFEVKSYEILGDE